MKRGQPASSPAAAYGAAYCAAYCAACGAACGAASRAVLFAASRAASFAASRAASFAALALLSSLAACAAAPPAATPVLLLYGEVHDNAAQHAQRLQDIEKLLERGARPALLMEQFDLPTQPAIDQARAAGADAVIAAAGASSGWQWRFYRPLIELALRRDLPIVAANVSRAEARRVIAEGLVAHGFDARVPADIEAAQAALIERSHCGLVDGATARRMAAAQIARDQAMARLVQQHASRGAVLIAGNGHVRRDIGVPRWLDAELRARVEVVGQIEAGGAGDDEPATVFDRVVVTPPQPRDDPCASMRRKG